MNILTLKFKDTNIEAEFAKLFHSISPRFYHTIIALLGISSLIFSILSFHIALIGEGIGTLACSIAFFVILWYRNKLRKSIPLIVFIAAEVVLGVGLYYTKIPFSYLSPKAIFYEGFSFGLYTILLSQFFPTLRNKLAFIIIAIICRYSILVPDSLGSILVNSIFDVTSVFLMFYQEKNIRDLFKRFHDYRDELSKFKSLLAYHIPQNIAIIRKDLDQKIFINNSFTNKFKAENVSQILSTASTLKIIKNTYDSGTAQEMETLFQRLPAPTLYDFLNACKNNNQNTMQIACFNVASTESEEAQVTYEAKVFNLNWDDCEALTIMLNDLTVQETILALKLADENKDKVLATVSHELRTPINGMLGITNLIEQDFQDTKLREYCKAAKICSKMLLNLVNSILDLSQIRNNCIKLNPTCFTIKELLDEIESIFHSQCLNKGLEFKIVSEEEYSEKIVSDRSRLTQVIVNLLANALKFTFQGEITLKVLKNRKGNEINFRIEDTGTGIKEEDKPKLFKMFGRLEQTDSTINTQGVGLGLTISNSLVKLLNPTKQNAKIELESEYGKGTTFFFAISRNLVDLVQSTEEDHSTIENLFFPEDRHGNALFPGSISEFSPKTDFLTPRIITTPTQKLLSPSMLSRMNKYKESDCPQTSNFTMCLNTEERDLLASKLQRKRTNKLPDIKESLLVVDDNALNLMIIAKLIEKKGYLVTTAFNGEDAIKKAKQQGKTSFFKVILMDCQMPIMDGFEATRILNQMMEAGEIPKVPIFALTANDTKQDQEKCLNAGMAAYLSKPLNEFELKKAIAKFAK